MICRTFSRGITSEINVLDGAIIFFRSVLAFGNIEVLYGGFFWNVDTDILSFELDSHSISFRLEKVPTETSVFSMT